MRKAMIPPSISNSVVFLILFVTGLSQIGTTQNLLGYWPLNGNANDLSGYGFNATLIGSPTWEADRNGSTQSAIRLDGLCDYLLISAAQSIQDMSDAYTIMGWIKMNELKDYNGIFLRSDSFTASSSQIEIYIDALGNLITVHNREDSNTLSYRYWGGDFAANVWYFVAIVWNGSSWTVYRTTSTDLSQLDRVGGNSNSYSPNPGDSPFLGMGYAGKIMNGMLDDFRIYGSALSETDIKENLFSENPIPIQVFNCGGEIYDFAFSPEGDTVFIGVNALIKIFDIATGRLIKVIRNESSHSSNHITDLDVSDDGKFVLFGQFNIDYAELWDIESGNRIQKYGPNDPWMLDFRNGFHLVPIVDISPDSNWVLTRDNEHSVSRLWNLQTGEEVYQFPSTYFAWVMEFSPDMKYVLSGGQLYNFETRNLVYLFFENPLLYASAFSPDSQYLLLGEANEITVRDLSRGYLIKRYVKYYYPDSLSFSPDGKMFACRSESNPIRILETFTGKILAEIHDAWHVAFSPDGKTLLTNGPEFKAYLWDLNDLIESQTGIKNYEQY